MLSKIPKMALKDQMILRLSIARKTSRVAFLIKRDSPPIPSKAAPTRRVVAGSMVVHPKRDIVQTGAINIGMPKI
jgi:hypothetical protein